MQGAPVHSAVRGQTVRSTVCPGLVRSVYMPLPNAQTRAQPDRDKRRGRFGVIYADPPWDYRTWSAGGRQVPYPTLPTADICSLPVRELAAEDCTLFLWATYPFLPDALTVVRAWGFRFRTVAFTWVKLNPTGRGYAFGLGYWTRANPEVCLLATRGRPARVGRSVPNLIVAPRREHSRKPDEARERIVALCGDVPRVELFARERADGWDAWGNEVTGTVGMGLAAAVPGAAPDGPGYRSGARWASGMPSCSDRPSTSARSSLPSAPAK